MPSNKTLAIASAWTAFFVTCIWFIVTYVPPFNFVFGLSSINTKQQRAILYHLDHASLSVVLREFAAQQRWSSPASGQQPLLFRSDEQAIPVTLRVLKPSSIRIDDDQIHLEFGGALLHYGISAFRPGLHGSGTKQLGEGIWFYADNGRYPNNP